MKFSISRVNGRGAGLGNELVPWARAFLMAQVSGARLLPPAFGLNQRNYSQHFGTSRTDWIQHRALMAALPCAYFGEEEYQRYGAGDVREAFSRYIQEKGYSNRQPIVYVTDGLWGGLEHIAAAREFARATLAGSRFAAANMAALGLVLDSTKVTVAMHVRLGDFAEVARLEDYRGVFNRSMPLDWFINGGLQIKKALGERVQFVVFSDGTPEQLAPLTRALDPVPYRPPAPADCSDLLAMASADLLFCSISSYSAWAAFLSGSYYAWFKPQLQPMDGGWFSIWGHEDVQRGELSPTQSALKERSNSALDLGEGRSFALDMDGSVPKHVLDSLWKIGVARRRCSDIVRYGVVN